MNLSVTPSSIIIFFVVFSKSIPIQIPHSFSFCHVFKSNTIGGENGEMGKYNNNNVRFIITKIRNNNAIVGWLLVF